MKISIITLSLNGLVLAAKLKESIVQADIFVHADVTTDSSAQTFDRVLALTDKIFNDYQGLIYIMPTGVVVRAIASKAQSKLTDPAIVAIDVAGRFAISLLSGHEGKAN